MDDALKPNRMEVTFLVSDIEWEGTSEYLRHNQDSGDDKLVGSTLAAELEIDLSVALALFLRRPETEKVPPVMYLEILTPGTPLCGFKGEVKETRTKTYPADDPHYGGLREISSLVNCGLLIPLVGVVSARFAPFEPGELLEGISVLRANFIRPRSTFGIIHKIKVVKVVRLRPHEGRHPVNYRLITGTITPP